MTDRRNLRKDLLNPSIRPNHERRPLHTHVTHEKKRLPHPNPEGRTHRMILIRNQRIRQTVLLNETPVALMRIRTDTENPRLTRKLLPRIPHRARLQRATRRPILRIKHQNHPLPAKLRQRNHPITLTSHPRDLCGEFWSSIARLQSHGPQHRRIHATRNHRIEVSNRSFPLVKHSAGD